MSSSVSGSLLNTSMHEVSDTPTYNMVLARVRGLLAIIKNQMIGGDVAAGTAMARGVQGTPR